MHNWARSARSPRRSSTRSRISVAALFVNVSARTDALSFSSSSRATRSVKTPVLPEPGPASTSRGPSFHPTARRWFSLRFSKVIMVRRPARAKRPFRARRESQR